MASRGDRVCGKSASRNIAVAGVNSAVFKVCAGARDAGKDKAKPKIIHRLREALPVSKMVPIPIMGTDIDYRLADWQDQILIIQVTF
jgi:hypothetical protein